MLTKPIRPSNSGSTMDVVLYANPRYTNGKCIMAEYANIVIIN